VVEQDLDKTKTVWQNLKHNFYEIFLALQIKEFYGVLIFQLTKGFIVPNFSTFGYYFQTDVLKVSK